MAIGWTVSASRTTTSSSDSADPSLLDPHLLEPRTIAVREDRSGFQVPLAGDFAQATVSDEDIMAARMHVVAARGATEEELADALSGVGLGPSGHGSGWAWMRLDAKGVAEATIDRALDALPGPTLRTTTVDGALWTLRLGRQGADPFLGAHWFILLDEGRVELEAAEYETLGAFWSGHDLPPELVDDPTAPVEPAAYEALIRRHADYLIEALHRFELAHEPDEVRAVLTGASATPTELGWDVGNLPRFLETLGVGSAVDGWRDDLDQDELELARNAAQLAKLRQDPLAAVRERLADAAPAALDGGPVELPIDELILLRDIGAQCAVGFGIGISLSADANEALLEPLGAIDDSYAGRIGDRIDVLLDDWTELSAGLRAASQALGRAAPGTDVEVVTAIVHGEPVRSANQRYSGALSEGAFRIAATFPAMSSEILSGALALMREHRAEGPVTARDEAEAEAFLAEAPEAIWFPMGKPEITVEGLTLKVEQWYDHEGVIQWFFARRFGSTWDVRERMEWHRKQAAEARARG